MQLAPLFLLQLTYFVQTSRHIAAARRRLIAKPCLILDRVLGIAATHQNCSGYANELKYGANEESVAY